MKLADMKMTKAEKKKNEPTPCGSYEGPDYPYGLSLRLDDASLEKLGIKSLPKVGAKMQIDAIGIVTSVSSHESKNQEDRTVEIQIQQLSVDGDDQTDMKDTLRKEYRRITSGKA